MDRSVQGEEKQDTDWFLPSPTQLSSSSKDFVLHFVMNDVDSGKRSQDRFSRGEVKIE